MKIGIFARAGTGLPKTSFAGSPKDADSLLEVGAVRPWGRAPGRDAGAVRGPGRDRGTRASSSVIGAFQQLDANCLVQEFIGEARGEDLRVRIVGGEVVESGRGPLVLEVDSSPGLEGVERHSGEPVTERITGCLERREDAASADERTFDQPSAVGG